MKINSVIITITVIIITDIIILLLLLQKSPQTFIFLVFSSIHFSLLTFSVADCSSWSFCVSTRWLTKQPGTERVQALADILHSALCCHSNETHAVQVNYAYLWKEVVQKDCEARNLNKEEATDRGTPIERVGNF